MLAMLGDFNARVQMLDMLGDFNAGVGALIAV